MPPMLGVVVARNGQVLADGAFLGPVIKIGRHPFSHVHLADDAVSEQHAVVARQGESWVLQDLGSKNGIFAGGRQVTAHVLNDGDELETAGFRLTFYLRGRLEKTEAPAVDPAAHAVFGQTLLVRSDHEQRERSASLNAHLVAGALRWVIDRDVLLIGGGEGCEVTLDDPRAARIAAAIVRGPGGFSIVPADAPVRRNGAPVATRAWLDAGDRIEVHGLELLFRLGSPDPAGEVVLPPPVPKTTAPRAPGAPPKDGPWSLRAVKARLEGWLPRG